MGYQDFIAGKTQLADDGGFEPLSIPDFMTGDFEFQAFLAEWAIRKGRGLVLADCGLGKTPIQLVWADNVV
ncbi:MAG: helicase, partial [Deltaproteobacteria bacterium]|nr:helicase [Deltaproteobacteria bacterium]